MTSERAVIGISAYEEVVPFGASTEPTVFVPGDYAASVRAAGAVALVLAIQPDAVEALLDRIDGLVLTGGPDVGAARYGAAPHPAAQAPRDERDAFELALLEAATRRDLPTLAICRGIQVLNVARGGTLFQHLPEVVGHDGHLVAPGEFVTHRVEIAARSRLGTILPPAVEVASQHHQAIDRLGRSLVVTARAEDGTIEAVEDPECSFLLGVQWHPEVGEDLSLFRALLVAADAARAAAPGLVAR